MYSVPQITETSFRNHRCLDKQSARKHRAFSRCILLYSPQKLKFWVYLSLSIQSPTTCAENQGEIQCENQCPKLPRKPPSFDFPYLSEYWPLRGKLTRLIVVIIFDILMFYLQINSSYSYPVISSRLNLVRTHPPSWSPDRNGARILTLSILKTESFPMHVASTDWENQLVTFLSFVCHHKVTSPCYHINCTERGHCWRTDSS